MGVTGKDIYDGLRSIFTNFHQKPFFFIGSGISIRYLDLPDWEQLLQIASRRIDNNNIYFYKSIKTKVSNNLQDQNITDKSKILPAVASELSRIYNERFFSDENFESDLKDKYFDDINSDVPPFKLLISNLVSSLNYNQTYSIEKNEFIKLKSHISGIITTNFDLFLESIFDDFDVFISQDDLINSKLYYDSEIYKINGCVKKPNTIVIDAMDYNEKIKKEKYLSSKLLTLFIEYPIIFMGYSINDENILQILRDLNICLNDEQRNNIVSRFLFVEYVDSFEDQGFDVVQKEGINFTRIKLYHYKILYQCLNNNIREGVPAKLIKRAKELISSLIENNSKDREKVFLSNIDSKSIKDETIAIHLAGNESIFNVGYRNIDTEKVYEDLIFNSYGFDPALMIKNFCEFDKARYSSSILPLHQYLKSYNGIVPPFTFKRIIYSIDDLFTTPNQKQKHQNHVKFTSISEILNQDISTNKKIECILYSIENFNLGELKSYILDTYNSGYYGKLKNVTKTNYKKILVYYDFLINK